ncbi:MAG TPA: Error-prone repair protein ImuA, partial [Niabella sp.]|nr:Error-prone repair protein ImuA [Niabella sp.]
MDAVKNDMIAQLRQEICRMQGQKPATDQLAGKVALGPVLDAFPQKVFPTGAIHEWITTTHATTAATTGFIAGILSGL